MSGKHRAFRAKHEPSAYKVDAEGRRYDVCGLCDERWPCATERVRPGVPGDQP